MTLIWTERIAPDGDCPYDHVIAETPLGDIRLEWKGWKENDSPCGYMPWNADNFVIGCDLDAAKAAAQIAWDAMVQKVAALSTQGPSDA